jgi:hypothetical protein
VEAETCSDTVINNNTNKNLLVAIAGILSERFLRVGSESQKFMKLHCKKQLCSTYHHLERNSTLKECLNL